MTTGTTTQDLTAKETIALESLRRNMDSSTTLDSDGTTWHDVYLDNAKPFGWDGKTWSGVLGSLEKKGLYRVVDGFAWGEVKEV